MTNNPQDKVPTDFIMKVYETKELAEEGDESNALLVFHNGIYDVAGANPLVSNGGQFIDGTTDGDTTAYKLIDENANFGTRLEGKTVVNTTDPGTAIITNRDSATQLTLDTDIMATAENYYIDNPGIFFIFRKYYYRIESTDPVLGFIIDWDDGEDNSREKANRELIKLESPRYYAITSHIYTTHGIHYPMIRTISPEGFYSKWYVSYDAVVADDLKSIETQDLTLNPKSTLQNDFSIVSTDNPQSNPTAYIRLCEFAPANMPPIGVLKLDRNAIFSGIDNTFISGTTPKGYARVLRDGVNVPNAIDIIYKTNLDKIHKETIRAHHEAGTVTASTALTLFPNTTHIESGEKIKEILSVKLVQMQEGTASATTTLGPDDRIFIQIYDAAADSPDGSDAVAASDRVVAAVSLGNPIVTLDRPGFYIDVNGGQSQTRASNVSIQKYWFEEGKLEGTIRSHPGANEISDAFADSLDAVFASGQTQEGTRLRYCFDYNRGNIIEAGVDRFFDDERLIRLQVEDTSATSRNDDTTFYSDGVPDDTGAATTETVDPSEVLIDVDDSTLLNVNDIIKVGTGTPGPGATELMKVKELNAVDLITVERSIEGTSASSYPFATGSIYRMADDGRQGDTITRSFIEHWDSSAYTDGLNRPDSIKSRGLLLYGNSNDDTVGGTTWTDRAAANVNNTSTDLAAGDTGLVFGGRVINTTPGAANNDNELTGVDFGHKKTPYNWLLCCKTDKFNKVHLRMENSWRVGATQRDSEGVYSEPGTANVSLMAWYTARTSPSATDYEWKSIPIIDGTATPDEIEDEYVSLRTAGTISFEMPQDWVSIQSSNLTSGSPVILDTGETDDPESLWTENMYGLLIGISVNEQMAAAKSYYRCFSVIPYNNSHSQAIKIMDPHHKSLNTIAIAQSISWKKQGKFIEITDRLGRSDLRRIGAAGGSITFGGVELSGDYTTTKGALARYQREATPVYLDIQRANGDYIRIYGVITSMSEDYPTGKQTPKFGISMQTKYIAEYDSSGLWITDGLVPLGGEIIDEPKYLL